MNIINLKLPILFIVIFIFLISCKSSHKTKEFKEGIIEYDVTYLDSEADFPIIGLLPSTIQIKFKDNLTVLRVNGWLGTFSTVYITDLKKNTNTTLLKILKHKYSYTCPLNEPMPGYEIPKDYSIELKNGHKRILGYKCKKAVISVPGSEFSPQDIYYTNQFEIQSKLLSQSLLREIPGFLFQFPLKMNGINMYLKIKSIKVEPVPDSEFLIPSIYQEVTKVRMQELINENL